MATHPPGGGDTRAPPMLSDHLVAKLVCAHLSVEDGHFARQVCKALLDATDDARLLEYFEAPTASAPAACTSLPRAVRLFDYRPAWADKLPIWGAENGCVDVVRWAGVRGREADVASAAMRHDQAGVLCFLLDRIMAAPDTVPACYDLDGWLVEASESGATACIFLLVDRGANLDGRLPRPSPPNNTALTRAASLGRASAVVTLLERGATLDLPSRNGHTALMWAAENGHASCVRELLARGADARREAAGGLTALQLASRYRHRACVRLLEERATLDL